VLMLSVGEWQEKGEATDFRAVITTGPKAREIRRSTRADGGRCWAQGCGFDREWF